MGLFTLGFLKGAADAYSTAKANEQQARTEAEKLREQREYEERKLAEERKYQEGVTAQEQLFKVGQDAQAAAVAEQAEIDKEKRRREAAAAYQEQISADPNAPMVLPSGYTLYQPPKPDKPTKTTPSATFAWTDLQTGEVAMWEGPDLSKGTAGERAKLGVRSLRDAFGSKMESWYDAYRRGDENAESNIQNYIAAMSQYAGKDLMDALSTPAIDPANPKARAMLDPRALFSINAFTDRPEIREWYDNAVISPLIGIATDAFRNKYGIPKDAPLTPSLTSNGVPVLIAEPPQQWEYTKKEDPTSPEPKIDPVIAQTTKKISAFSGVPAPKVKQIANNFPGNAQQRMNTLKAKNQRLQEIIPTIRLPNGSIYVDPDNANAVNEVLNGMSPDLGITLIRTAMPKQQSRGNTLMLTQGGVQENYLDGKYVADKYGMDRKAVQTRWESANEAKLLAENMISVLQAGGEAGMAYKITDVLSTGVNLMDSIRSAANKYVFNNPQLEQQFTKNTQDLESFLKMDALEQQKNKNAIMGMLHEQLAFALAAAWQKGEGGRAISNEDVQAAKAGLNVLVMSATNQSAIANLNYLRKEMDFNAAVFGKISAATTEDDLAAGIIYHRTMRPYHESINTFMGHMGYVEEGVGAQPQPAAPQSSQNGVQATPEQALQIMGIPMTGTK